MQEQFTKYEIARILGARALQIAMDAPLLLKIEEKELDRINYDPLKIAEIEFKEGVLPITVKRPFPQKREAKIKKIEEKPSEEKIAEVEKKEEKEIKEEGEIMELTNPGDEGEEIAEEESEESE